MGVIEVSAVVFVNEHNEILTVRKRGTTGFMMPGGKPEPGESPAQTGVREISEELGLELSEDSLRKVGIFETAALNEPDMLVRANVFMAPRLDRKILDALKPSAEIDEFRWVQPGASDHENQAPLNLEYIFPAVARMLED